MDEMGRIRWSGIILSEDGRKINAARESAMNISEWRNISRRHVFGLVCGFRAFGLTYEALW
jgi:hypothetical protein